MDEMITSLGLLAGSLTTLAFLPQFVKTWKTRSVRDFSLVTLIAFCTGIFLWLIYGIARDDIAIILANLITLILNLGILYLKLKYR